MQSGGGSLESQKQTARRMLPKDPKTEWGIDADDIKREYEKFQATREYVPHLWSKFVVHCLVVLINFNCGRIGLRWVMINLKKREILVSEICVAHETSRIMS